MSGYGPEETEELLAKLISVGDSSELFIKQTLNLLENVSVCNDSLVFASFFSSDLHTYTVCIRIMLSLYFTSLLCIVSPLLTCVCILYVRRHSHTKVIYVCNFSHSAACLLPRPQPPPHDLHHLPGPPRLSPP